MKLKKHLKKELKRIDAVLQLPNPYIEKAYFKGQKDLIERVLNNRVPLTEVKGFANKW